MNTDRYINADELLRAMTVADLLEKDELEEWVQAHCVGIPPIIQATWEYSPNAHDYNLGGYICSNCHKVNRGLDGIHGAEYEKFLYMIEGSHFCPTCGARMVKEVSNEEGL